MMEVPAPDPTQLSQCTAASNCRPSVTVVIPCFNQACYLTDSIESARFQSYRPEQIIVVDDGSTDATAAVAQAFSNVVYLHQRNRGLAAARNTGLHAATGELVVFLDADDRLRSCALAWGVGQLVEHPEWAFVHGHYRYIDRDGRLQRQWQAPSTTPDYRELLEGNPIGMHGTVMYRTAILNEAGGFDERLAACEDYELYLRLAGRQLWGRHRTVVAEYRQHATNMSRDSVRMLKSVLDVLHRHRPTAERGAQAARSWQRGLHHWKRLYCRQQLASRANDDARPTDTSAGARHTLPGPDAARVNAEMRLLAPREMLEVGFARHIESAQVRLTGLGRMARLKLIPNRWRAKLKRRLARRVAFGDFDEMLPRDPDNPERAGEASVYEHYAIEFLRRNRFPLTGRGLLLTVGNARRWAEQLVQVVTWASDRTRLVPGKATDERDVFVVQDSLDDPESGPGLEAGEVIKKKWTPPPAVTHDSPNRNQARVVSVSDGEWSLGHDTFSPPPEPATLDWVVIDRALQFQDDIPDMLKTIVEWLRPGGVVMSLFAGIGRPEVSHQRPLWWVLPHAAEQLHCRCPRLRYVELDQAGNVAASLAWLYRLPAGSLTDTELEQLDVQYPLFVAATAFVDRVE